MNHLLGASIAAGGVAAGVAAGIKSRHCRPYLDSPLMQVKLFTARSFVGCKVGKNMKMDNEGHRLKEKKFPQFFTKEGNTQEYEDDGYPGLLLSDDEDIVKIVSIDGDVIDDDDDVFDDDDDDVFFDDDVERESDGEVKTTAFDDDVEREFDGEVKSTAVDYLGTLDWESLQNHIICFPRKRSEDEVKLLFEKLAAHYDRKYPSAELKEMRFAIFKKRLAIADEGNLKGEFTSVLKADFDIEG